MIFLDRKHGFAFFLCAIFIFIFCTGFSLSGLAFEKKSITKGNETKVTQIYHLTFTDASGLKYYYVNGLSEILRLKAQWILPKGVEILDQNIKISIIEDVRFDTGLYINAYEVNMFCRIKCNNDAKTGENEIKIYLPMLEFIEKTYNIKARARRARGDIFAWFFGPTPVSGGYFPVIMLIVEDKRF